MELAVLQTAVMEPEDCWHIRNAIFLLIWVASHKLSLGEESLNKKI